MYNSIELFTKYKESSQTVFNYFENANISTNRPLNSLKIDKNNYGKFTQLIENMLDYKEYKYSDLSDRFIWYMDCEYSKSVEHFIREKPKLLFTDYELSYLHDIYLLSIGINEYFRRCNVEPHKSIFINQPITINEILNSAFYKEFIFVIYQNCNTLEDWNIYWAKHSQLEPKNELKIV